MSDDIKQLAREALEDDRAATPGPWNANHGSWNSNVAFVTPYGLPGLLCHSMSRSDIAFIAAARTREPRLAAEVLRLHSEIQESEAHWIGIEADATRAERDRARKEVARLTELLRPRDGSTSSWITGANTLEAFLNERRDLCAKLAAMTAARDEACDLAVALTSPSWARVNTGRIAKLRAVGKDESQNIVGDTSSDEK